MVPMRHIGWRGCEIVVVGKGQEQRNWSIAQLRTEEDFESGANRDAFRLIETLARRFGAKTVCAPHPASFNAELCVPEDLRMLIRSDISSFVLRRGKQADAVLLPPGTGFYLSSADCPTLVVTTPDRLMIAAHAGRDSLMDVGLLVTGKPRRKNFSVVDTIASFVHSPKMMSAFIVCGIGAEHFPHPWNHKTLGKLNEARTNYARLLSETCVRGRPEDGKLELREIIRAQFKKYGVSDVCADGIDTFSDQDSLGNHLWWSRRRGDKARNGVLIINKG